jgi:hypothetical protein
MATRAETVSARGFDCAGRSPEKRAAAIGRVSQPTTIVTRVIAAATAVGSPARSASCRKNVCQSVSSGIVPSYRRTRIRQPGRRLTPIAPGTRNALELPACAPAWLSTAQLAGSVRARPSFAGSIAMKADAQAVSAFADLEVLAA